MTKNMADSKIPRDVNPGMTGRYSDKTTLKITSAMMNMIITNTPFRTSLICCFILATLLDNSV
ncbi:hypothetical protein D3C78_1630060 [compost metagenome]